MHVFNATYYDGLSSKATHVLIRVDEQGMLSAEGFPSGIQIGDIDVRPRIGNTARKIYLPEGAYIESDDNDILDDIVKQWATQNKASRSEGIIHKLESHSRFVALAIVATLAIAYGAVKYGIPLASEQVTQWLPYEVDQALGKNVLPELDKSFFNKSTLSAERQAEIKADFEMLLSAVRHITVNDNLVVEENDPRHYQLVFRSSPVIGANAFALPDGTVVMTDELVELVEDPKYLSGILLHEIGHVKHRHSLQTLVSQASFSALVLVFTGDISLASSLVLLLPSILIEAEHSRKFEYESDTYALEAMQYLNIPTEYFSIAMEKLMSIEEDESEAHHEDKGKSSLFGYFSTHPPTQERIDRFRQQPSRTQ